MMLIELFLLHALFLSIPLAYYKYKGCKKQAIAKELGIGKKELREAPFPALKLFAAMLAVTIIFGALMFALGLNDSQKVQEMLKEIAGQKITIAYMMLIGVTLEEFFFRGFLQKRIGKEASSVIFGALHFGYGSVAELFGAIILGYVLALGFERYKNLYANIFAHMLYNSIALSAVLFG